MLEQPDAERVEAHLQKFARAQASYVYDPREGKTLTIGTMLVTLKATGAETAGRFALLEVTVPPYFADIMTHLHHRTTKAIYLTQGMLAVTLGEETMVVRQGSFIMVPPQQIHRFWNPAATQATFLVYFAPAGAEEFFEALAASGLLEEAHRPDFVAQIWALGTRYDHFPAEA